MLGKELFIEILGPGAPEAARGYTEKEAGHPRKKLESFKEVRMASVAALCVASHVVLS